MADATVAPGEDSTMAASADMIDLLAAEPSEEHKAEVSHGLVAAFVRCV